MQEVLRGMCTCEWPIFLLPPLIGAHDKDLYRLRVGKAVGDVLEEIVIPVQSDIAFVERGRGAKVHVADFAPRAGMSSDRNQQSLPPARCLSSSVRSYPDIVAQRSTEKNVVPSRDSQGGYANFGIVVLNRPAFPIVVIARMSEPIEKIGSKRAQARLVRNGGQVVQRVFP